VVGNGVDGETMRKQSVLGGCLPLLLALGICAGSVMALRWAGESPANADAMLTVLRREYDIPIWTVGLVVVGLAWWVFKK
jgi:hypothetical protein